MHQKGRPGFRSLGLGGGEGLRLEGEGGDGFSLQPRAGPISQAFYSGPGSFSEITILLLPSAAQS
jgi:hypothetical protein